MRPLTASFESSWLISELLQMTLASLTIRMMQLTLRKYFSNNWISHHWDEMRNAPSSRLFSQPTQLLSSSIINKVARATSFKKSNSLTHLPTSWKAFRSAAIQWSASCWTMPSQSKQNLYKNQLNDQAVSKYQTLCHTKNRGFWIWLLNAWGSHMKNPKIPAWWLHLHLLPRGHHPFWKSQQVWPPQHPL